MKIRAKTTFVGTFNMKKDEIKECDDRRVVNDLKKLGLVEDVPEEKEYGVRFGHNGAKKRCQMKLILNSTLATFDELRESLEKVAKRYTGLCRKRTKKRRKRIQQG